MKTLRTRGIRLRRAARFTCRTVSWLIPVLVVSLLVNAGCTTGPTETKEHTFTVGDSAVIVVDAENTEVEVNGIPGDAVTVKTKLVGASRITYTVSQDGKTITIEIKIDKPWWSFGGGPSAAVTVGTPTASDVQVVTSNGRIQVTGVQGTHVLNTSNGAIALNSVKGEVEAETSNGAVEIDGMEGSSRLRTSNGRLDLRGIEADIDAETSNGQIDYSGNMTAGSSTRLVTSNGRVEVEIGGTPSVAVDAETSNGEVTSEFPITVTSSGQTRLVGVIGDGQAELYIRTSNGDITIR